MAEIRTQRELAKAVGVSQSTINRRLRDGSWPKNVPVIPPWTESHVRMIGSGAQAGVSADIRSIKEQQEAKRLAILTLEERERKIKLAKEAGDLLSRSQVEHEREVRINAVTEMMFRSIHDLPAVLHGQSESTIERILRERMTDICAAFRGDIKYMRSADELLGVPSG